jgi:hypothetical protein
MARDHRGKKALYEVMSKARSKPGYGRALQQPPAEKTGEDTPVAKQNIVGGTQKGTAKWWRKPRFVQLNAGRIEFSMPYQVAVAVGLVLVLVLLASYRLGQRSSALSGPQGRGQPGGQTPQVQKEAPTGPATSNVPRPSAPLESAPPKPEKVEPVKPAGTNVIVLVQYDAMADLLPVQAHFAENGIDTEIVTENGRYFLQTRQRYDNPATPGTDGYKARQKIAEVGAKYKGKAPPGYEPFAPYYFSDAYGKKVEK